MLKGEHLGIFHICLMYTLQNMARGYKIQLQLWELEIESGGWKLFENGRRGDIKGREGDKKDGMGYFKWRGGEGREGDIKGEGRG